MKIGILSDTHGYLDQDILQNLSLCDEIWHIGDFGPCVADRLKELKPLRGVYGNIDGYEMRYEFPEHQRFTVEGFDVWMTHIGGYPGRYDIKVREGIISNPPDIFLSGHSHILKIMPDTRLNLLHINPGSAGNQGFHKIRTMVVLEIEQKNILDIKAIELGPRARKFNENQIS